MVFYVDKRGYVDGKPYVLPHLPGDQAFGLIQGWYYGVDEGPFESEYEAIWDQNQ